MTASFDSFDLRQLIDVMEFFQAKEKVPSEKLRNRNESANKAKLDCDFQMLPTRPRMQMKCDLKTTPPPPPPPPPQRSAPPFITCALIALLAVALATPTQQSHSSSITIIDHHRSNAASGAGAAAGPKLLASHLQPISALVAQNRSINFTHVVWDELTGSIYLGATNWLLQVNGRDLKLEQAIRTGPTSVGGAEQPAARDCAPADCQTPVAPLMDLDSLLLHHSHMSLDLSGGTSGGHAHPKRTFGFATMHSGNQSGHHQYHAQLLQAQRRTSGTPTGGAATTTTTTGNSQQVPATTPTSATPTTNQPNQQASQQQQQQQQMGNNYNKILSIDYESRHLLVCGSLNQGACRRHQLGNLANFSELIPLPVASNDEHSSTVALIASQSRRGGAGQAGSGNQVIYVAATNTRLGPYREMVPAISARSLDFSSRDRSMQIIERSFTDLARVDISFELRDYYLVNYVTAFQHNDYVYFATVQRKSPLRQLEELGYVTRLARLCLGDMSFQSYTEMTLECVGAGQVNYNLLQDAHLMQAGSHPVVGGSRAGSGAVLAAVFAQSRDHTTRSSAKSAVCLFHMDQVERKFNENIDLCYNGTTKSRNMNYIAGSVSDCPRPSAGTSIGNYCNEPIKLNGSLALTSEPIVSYASELLTSVASTLAPTSPLSIQMGASPRGAQTTSSSRQHQVLLVGTGSGQLKRLVLVSDSASQKIRAIEFDSLDLDTPTAGHAQPDTAAGVAVLADLQLMPRQNPQLQWGGGGGGVGGGSSGPMTGNQTASKWHQHALVATSHKLVKVRINSCKATQSRLLNHSHQQTGSGANSSTVDECLACAQLQDPFCGWCASSAACTTRDECLTGGIASATPIHWTPFDSIRCSNYQPISPKNLPLQAAATHNDELVDVNVRLATGNYARPTSARLAQAAFTCHFDFLAHWNRSTSATDEQPLPRPSGATTKATQARLNPHASTVAIGCPLPAASQRPASFAGADQLKVRLSVRLLSVQQDDRQGSEARAQIERALGMRTIAAAAAAAAAADHQQSSSESIERELTLYDCSVHSSCHSCLSAGSQGRRWSCAWCPLSQRCTFNASHPDFGCAAQAVASTTPHSLPGLATPIRGSHLTASLDRAQAEVLSMSLDKLAQCPSVRQQPGDTPTGVQAQPEVASQASNVGDALAAVQRAEILVPNNVRRAIQVPLARPIGHYQRDKRVIKLECLVELEGTRARFPARLVDNNNILCQETLFAYQSEISLQKASLSVILNENQVIEMSEVIIYKCHLFGVSPPALTSSVVARPPVGQPPAYSSASWTSSAATVAGSSGDSFLNFIQTAAATIDQPVRRSSDCSLCVNVERKFQCSWCGNQCKFSDQCQELAASTCPPPRIDSIHPNVGPLEGGTLLTIEGSNLGSNEREIQDKILVGGEPCQLLMYSVSTRIVCKTGPSLMATAATVFVGNRAGVTSALDKFHYKAVHLSDVSPRVGPVSGGTRLYLTGANLNIGSRIQVFLDDIPCPLDSNYEMSSSQIACITGPNLVVNSMRISKLTLQVDNSTHHLPYPFTYLPDPIIHSIEPAESFISGGRLLLITGQHLASPQSIRLQVFHEFQTNLSNSTTCMRQNDTCVTCLTPAFSRDLLALGHAAQQHAGEGLDQVLGGGSGDVTGDGTNQVDTWNTPSGGVKLKMALLMDDVRSARNLDEYYHHLPHHLAYFEDPRLFKLPNLVVEYRDELLLAGEHLQMRQLDQDMLITVGVHVCAIKSISGDRVTCQPPAQIAPVYNDRRQLVEQPLLPIVALIGSNLRYELGYMQYTSGQYRQQQQQQQQQQQPLFDGQLGGDSWAPNNYNSLYGASPSMAAPPINSSEQQATGSWVTFVVLSLLGLVIAFGVSSLLVAMVRFRSAKAEQREYKRIQLQMGSLDAGGGGPPLLGGGGGLFDKIHSHTGNYLTNGSGSLAGGQFRFNATGNSPPTLSLAAGGGGGGKTKPFYQFFTSANQHQQHQQQHQQPQRLFPEVTGSPAHHVLKLASNGMIVSSAAAGGGHYEQCGGPAGSSSSTSPGGSSSSRHLLAGQQTNYTQRQFNNNNNNNNSNNWTQEAPSTIVPYAVIEACNLTLEGKQAIKREYV